MMAVANVVCRIGAERNNYYRLERALCILTMHPGSKLTDFDVDPNKSLDYDFRSVRHVRSLGLQLSPQ